MKADFLLEMLNEKLGINFYTGVPDSQLKALCDTIYARFGLGKQHIVAANEGAAVGLAAGHYLATGRPALVYLQNSGIGNIINPVASLLDAKVYGIPCVFAVGWRGEPGLKDEPQHLFQGEITIELLELMKIKCFVISKETDQKDFINFVELSKSALEKGQSVAFVFCKGALETETKAYYKNNNNMKREDALKTIITYAGEDNIFVSTTGKTSRELFEIREALNQGHEKDFLTVGSMGHASMIATGIALNLHDRKVWCIDGDGAAIMHLGNMIVMAKTGLRNLIHVVFNNGAHESVGGMPVAYGKTDFCALAKDAGYSICMKVNDETELINALQVVVKKEEPCFIEIMVALGSRADLGRPTTTPKENKTVFISYLKGK